MNTKLTLNIDDNIIEDAKLYAKDNSVSLSKLIENYLQSLTKKKFGKGKISPLVESLTGVISLEINNYKKEYSDYLAKKYS
ncbi:MAG: DUF6364 family protein [Ginsengibacter sp.]